MLKIEQNQREKDEEGQMIKMHDEEGEESRGPIGIQICLTGVNQTTTTLTERWGLAETNYQLQRCGVHCMVGKHISAF